MKKISKFFNSMKKGNWGFTMDEVMSGEHKFEPGFGAAGSHHMEFRVTWGPKNFGQWINPWYPHFLKNDLSGTVTIGGLCENESCSGSLELNYFDEHKIRYTFDFTTAGKQYHFVGEKVNIQLHNLPFSHTTCFGTLVEKESNKLVSRSVTYFRLWTAPEFVTSLRLANA
ncbi:hypothetical protein ACFL27_08320 [candidate division CSSED10-310 bacterium]|uniref:Uncharacterized protein n=1 Tax=candidate division CSSED10-310 bacterium TaxID=2855610 RepID=A0ABV6YVF7_UNCC1